jgi:hypothetical protein
MDKSCGNTELALTEKVHGYGTVDKIGLGGKRIIVGVWKGLVFEFLK